MCLMNLTTNRALQSGGRMYESRYNRRIKMSHYKPVDNMLWQKVRRTVDVIYVLGFSSSRLVRIVGSLHLTRYLEDENPSLIVVDFIQA